jgi:hypothetical protein
MSLAIKVDVVQPPRAIHVNGHSTLYQLEKDPPPVHVVTLETPTGEWREEIHGGKDAAKLFIRGVRAGCLTSGVSIDVELDWI